MILILISVLLICAQQKLIMVQSVFRHGARYPIYPNEYDNTTYAIEQDKAGQLTSSGKRMHYLLGKLMYQEYWKQLGLGNKLKSNIYLCQKYKCQQVQNIICRTIQSVQSQLFGMFQQLEGWSLNETQANLSYPSWRNASTFGIQSKQGAVYPDIEKFHSTPIHVEKLGSDRLDPGDFLRNYAPQNCPSQHKWQEQNQKSQLALSIYNIPRMQQAIKQITQFYHFQYNMTLYNMSNYVDNYFCSKYLDKPYAKNIYEGPYQQEYNYINTLSLYINLFFTDLQINATVSGFLNATRDNMMNVMKSSMEQKLIIYSAHDTTVANVLAGFRLATAQCVLDQYLKKNTTGLPACIVDYPYYASNLILQLHQNDNTQKYFVKLRYNGDYLPLFVCGNKVQCPWQQFDKFLVDTIRPNYLEQCGIPQFITKNKTLQTWLIVGASVMGGLFIILAIHIMYKSRKLSKQAIENNKSSLSQSLVIPN